MADITHALTVSFLRDALNGVTFDFSSSTTDVYKLALYDAVTSVDYTTTAYSTTNEITGTGYTAGGATLTIATNPTISGRYIYLTFSDVTWSSASFSAGSGLIYQADGSANRSVAVLSFGQIFTVSSGNFVVDMPTELIKLVATTAG